MDVSEDQKETGFYGLTIETGEDDAIVTFRGSESVDVKQIIEDWIIADLGIINGEQMIVEIAVLNQDIGCGDCYRYGMYNGSKGGRTKNYRVFPGAACGAF